MILNEESHAWQVFTLLEAFADEWGGWRVQDVLGKSIFELPEDLVSDLLQLRSLRNIMVKTMKEETPSGG